MGEKADDKELDAMKAAIASLREDIARLVADAKTSAGGNTTKANNEGAHDSTGGESQDSGEHAYGVFADLLHTLNSSRIQGEKVIKGLADEVERFPLVSIMAAFGLGYIIAKVWYQENKQ